MFTHLVGVYFQVLRPTHLVGVRLEVLELRLELLDELLLLVPLLRQLLVVLGLADLVQQLRVLRSAAAHVRDALERKLLQLAQQRLKQQPRDVSVMTLQLEDQCTCKCCVK